MARPRVLLHVIGWSGLVLGVGLRPSVGSDCNTNGLEDACDLSCGTAGGPCAVPGCGASADCNSNGTPDECDLAAGVGACRFPVKLSGNTTGYAASYFIGPPDDSYIGLGGQIVTYEFDCAPVIDGPGRDFTVYEVDSGTAEFNLMDVLVSANGVNFVSVKSSEGSVIRIPGDGAHGNDSFARSYDLSVSGLTWVRHIRIDGNGTGSAGGSTGFDLDAIGAVHLREVDCDANGRLDTCEIAAGTSSDCDQDGVPDVCGVGGLLRMGDRDDFDNADGDGVADLVTGNSVNYPGSGSGETSGSGESYTDVTINSGTDYSYVLSLPKGFYASATLRIFAFDAESAAGWGAAPIRLDGADSGFRLTLVPSTPSFNPGYVRLDEFTLTADHRLKLADGSLTVTLAGSAAATGDGAVVDYIEFEYVLADCNGNGIHDRCDIAAGTGRDCNANKLIDACELGAGMVADCNGNSVPDACDVAGGTSPDANANGTPDECERDCNSNGIPDLYEIAQGSSPDCNHNNVPDDCDLAGGTSSDCNADGRPDECPICPPVEVVFLMDTSDSMDDEAAVLCTSITQVLADLENDGLAVQESLLGISENPGGAYGCLTDNAIHLFGTTVPGSPPPGNQTLGNCPGGNEVASEDWGRATSVVAGVKAWLPDSVRLIIPLSDEGPWCGDPVTDPGVDRDSIIYAIGIAQTHSVIVSPITGSGSSSAVLALADELATGTGGTHFSSSQPAQDLADAIKALILDACRTVFDCNTNGIPDDCDLAGGTSADCDTNGTPDECDPNCNTNGRPDACDIAGGTSTDCDANGTPDECEPDCNTNGIADACDIAGGANTDCNTDGVPDECVLGLDLETCHFPVRLSGNTTGFAASYFIGPPDDSYIGLGGQTVTYAFDCALPLNGVGMDFTVYEVDSGSAEFDTMDVLVSANGVDFVSVKSSEGPAARIPGDEAHGDSAFARSYDLTASGLMVVRYVRIDGNGTGGAGGSTGFDLDAIGAVHLLDWDCNHNGTLDWCDIAQGTSADCNANGLADECELAGGLAPDCNSNAVPDVCDITGGPSHDVNANGIPDECEPDCNSNGIPDDHDLVIGTSLDCNDNTIPDECDLTGGTSTDCNHDGRPDECPICPPVEVVFLMDTSSSMDDEAAALCGSITQVVTDLEADGIAVQESLLGISENPGGAYGCLTDNVIHLFGTTVPGSPPPSNQTLGDCPGGNEVASEDWGRATSVVAGVKAWLPDSVRLIIPLSDEGPWCGDPVSDPGVDRDSIMHALTVAQAHQVIVSPITGSGASAAVVALAQTLAAGTGGTQFSSTQPAADIADAIKALILDACRSVFDCNSNGIPDDCDLAGGTSHDCNTNGTPDECDARGDFDADGRVDLADYADFAACLTEPCAVPPCAPPLYSDPCCVPADYDDDGDVDLKDFAAFQKAFTG